MLYLRFTRLGSVAAILAGVLRILTSFIPPSGSVFLRSLYLMVDILLFLGLISIYGSQRKDIKWWGLSSFVVACAGSALLIGRDLDSAAASLYPVAALLLAIGMSSLTISVWVAKRFRRWWAAGGASSISISTFLGITYTFYRDPVLFLVAGVLFGLGFVSAGIEVWLATKNAFAVSSS